MTYVLQYFNLFILILVTPKDWDLSLTIQNEFAIVILIIFTLYAWRWPRDGQDL